MPANLDPARKLTERQTFEIHVMLDSEARIRSHAPTPEEFKQQLENVLKALVTNPDNYADPQPVQPEFQNGKPNWTVLKTDVEVYNLTQEDALHLASSINTYFVLLANKEPKWAGYIYTYVKIEVGIKLHTLTGDTVNA